MVFIRHRFVAYKMFAYKIVAYEKSVAMSLAYECHLFAPVCDQVWFAFFPLSQFIHLMIL